MAKNKKEKEIQKTAAIPPIDAKRTAGALGGGGVAGGGIINQRINNNSQNPGSTTANINGKRELQKLPLLMETAPGMIRKGLNLKSLMRDRRMRDSVRYDDDFFPFPPLFRSGAGGFVHSKNSPGLRSLRLHIGSTFRSKMEGSEKIRFERNGRVYHNAER